MQHDAPEGEDRISKRITQLTTARAWPWMAAAAFCSGQGAWSNDKKSPAGQGEPDDHTIGRSRGGLTTKTHAIVDGNGLPLALIVGPGQARDSPALPKLLAELNVPRLGPGRPRTTPTALRGDKAYSSRGHRALLRSRGIVAVIPQPADRVGHRKNKGSRGGRPVGYEAED
ncbi:MAG: transposase [Frankiales bacterium]|nr:transposase [Frankiales bacterium]